MFDEIFGKFNGGVMNKENHLVEYKRELSETLERSVIAFLNSTGGHIYIGVNDDGSVYGVKDIDHVQRQVADRILNNIKPNAIGLTMLISLLMKTEYPSKWRGTKARTNMTLLKMRNLVIVAL